MILELRALGLSINSKKTTILNSVSTDNDIKAYFPSLDDRLPVIESMWRSRSKKVIARSAPILYQFFMEHLANGNTQSRTFRFCVSRLKTLIRSDVFSARSLLGPDVASVIIGELSAQPASTDQFCKLMMDVDMSDCQIDSVCNYIKDSNVAIYGWQNYHLLMLLAYKRYVSADLIIFCKDIIARDPFKPEVPACFIYLASIGHESDVEGFISQFKEEWPYQHQRFFLIALRNASNKILRPIFGRVGFRLIGTVDRLKTTKGLGNKAIFIKDYNKTAVSRIFDEISPYD